MGMAFDPQSTTGVIECNTDFGAGVNLGFPIGATVAIIKGGQVVRFDDADDNLIEIFSHQNLASSAFVSGNDEYAVGDALYLSYKVLGNLVIPMISKEIPYDQDAASNPTGADIDVKAVYYVGFVLEVKTTALSSQAAGAVLPTAIWFDPKLIAMEG